MQTDFDGKIGTFHLFARDGINRLKISSYSENNLWYHYLDQVTEIEYKQIGPKTGAIVRVLSNSAAYELWHNQLGHPGETIMDQVHHHVKT